MSAEAYYAPTEGAPEISIAQFAELFRVGGLPCTIEPDTEELHWVVFDSRQTTIYTGTKDGWVVLATLHAVHLDPPEFVQALDRILTENGFSADPEGF